MTDSAITSVPRSSLKRVAFASGVGTSLEFYDFAIYGTATALVFTDTFFTTGAAAVPCSSPSSGWAPRRC